MAVVTMPIGFGTDGLPAGMQLALPPGNDGALLSLSLAFEKLFPNTVTAPPATPDCYGCTHMIGVNTVSTS